MLSNDNKLLENGFDILNNVYFNGELPKAVITIQSSPKTYGYITVYEVWRDNESNYHEINISAEHLSRPIENIMATLLHEMVHLFCMVNKIADTSKNGRYHNKRFKEESEKRDLLIEYVQYIGYSKTTPTEKFIEVLKGHGLYTGIVRCRTGVIFTGGENGGNSGGGGDGEVGKAKRKKKTSTRKYICNTCGINVRATKNVNILCGDCMEPMTKID